MCARRWRVAGAALWLFSGGARSLALIRVDPRRYAEVARMDGVLKHEPCWTAPVLHRGILYARDMKEAVALKISAD